jgi:serine/threonine protein kinase
MTEEINKRIGDYQILDELGSGGMGRVYRVRNVISDRIEAMKVLLPDLAGRQELAARFLREIKLMASLNHPNIATLRTAFTADNQLIMIMEYVEGTTLAQLLEKGPIPPADAVNYIGQVLDALSYAHQQHIIHRDIKPSNMMLTPQGVIKLMDFGIARAGDEHTLTMTGTTLGSLGYMSPEQVKGETTDARSDLYSVGVSLYEMVTGQRPFRAESDYSIMAAHVKEMPKAPIELQPGLPTALNDIIFMAIAKEPAKRFQTAAAFRNALSTVKIAAPSVKPNIASGATTVNTLTPAEVAKPVPVSTPSQAAASISVSGDSKTPTVVAVSDTPSIPIPPPQPASHRGLYMTLGALVVLIGLVAAGVYLPRKNKTEAKNSASAASQAQNVPAESIAAQSPPAQNVSAQGAEPQSAGTASQNPVMTAPAAVPATGEASAMPQQASPAASAPMAAAPDMGRSTSAPTNPAANNPAASKMPDSHPRKLIARKSEAGQSAPALPPGVDPASDSKMVTSKANELDELEHQVDQLSSRAAAVDGGLERLQQQQASAGYGLRSDIAARQASMKNNLSKAEAALENGDVERARKYHDLAQADVEAIEHFLGR